MSELHSALSATLSLQSLSLQPQAGGCPAHRGSSVTAIPV